MSILNVGSLVELVSGSPRLTVEKMEHTTMHCVWFNNGECHREAFDMAVLRKCEDRKPDSGGFGGGRGGDRGGDRGGRPSFGGGGRGNDRGGDRGGRDERRGPPKDRGGFGKKDPTSFRKD